MSASVDAGVNLATDAGVGCAANAIGGECGEAWEIVELSCHRWCATAERAVASGSKFDGLELAPKVVPDARSAECSQAVPHMLTRLGWFFTKWKAPEMSSSPKKMSSLGHEILSL